MRVDRAVHLRLWAGARERAPAGVDFGLRIDGAAGRRPERDGHTLPGRQVGDREVAVEDPHSAIARGALRLQAGAEEVPRAAVEQVLAERRRLHAERAESLTRRGANGVAAVYQAVATEARRDGPAGLCRGRGRTADGKQRAAEEHRHHYEGSQLLSHHRVASSRANTNISYCRPVTCASAASHVRLLDTHTSNDCPSSS